MKLAVAFLLLASNARADCDANIAAAKELQVKGRYQESLVPLATCMSGPTLVEANHLAGRAYCVLGDAERARSCQLATDADGKRDIARFCEILHVSVPSPINATGSCDEVVARARDLYVHGQYDSAITIVQQLDARPDCRDDAIAAKSARIGGSSACALKDPVRASTYFRRADAGGKQLMKYQCAKAGIAVP